MTQPTNNGDKTLQIRLEMGFPCSIFIERPNGELICAICREVQDTPTSTPCGHTFCKACVKEWTDQDDSTNNHTCPTCRFSWYDGECDYDKDEGEERYLQIDHNQALHRIINNMQVKCPNNKEEECGDTFSSSSARTRSYPDADDNDRPIQRRKLDETGQSHDILSSTSSAGCEWTGCLGDWEAKHKGQCPLEIIECNVPSCNFKCPRKDMDAHMDKGSSRIEHMKLLINHEKEKIRQEREEVIQKAIQEHEGKVATMETIMNRRIRRMETILWCLPFLIGPALYFGSNNVWTNKGLFGVMNSTVL